MKMLLSAPALALMSIYRRISKTSCSLRALTAVSPVGIPVVSVRDVDGYTAILSLGEPVTSKDTVWF